VPSIVLIIIGNEQAKKMTNIFMKLPIPRKSIATGISAGGGRGRKSSMIGSNKLYARLDIPMNIPIGIIIKAARVYPLAIRVNVVKTSIGRRPLMVRLKKVVTSLEIGGK
jgi:hypothetical protein